MTSEHMYKKDSEVSKLPKVAESILDRANDKPCQRQCRSMESEYMCGMLIGSMLAAQVSIGNTRSSERQNLSETVSGDGK